MPRFRDRNQFLLYNNVLSICLTLSLTTSSIYEVHGGHALHASSFQIQQLWEKEQETIGVIQSVSESLRNVTNVLQRYMSSWEGLSDAKDNIESLGDPAATYALLRHVSEGWKEVDESMRKAKDVYNQIEHLASRPDREPLPNNDDVVGASEALVKLAHFYRFNRTSLARGILQETLKGKDDPGSTSFFHLHSLSVEDLTSIGLAAVNKGYFNVGVDFLKAARSQATTMNIPKSDANYEPQVSVQKIESLLQTALKVHNHVLDMRGPRSLTHSTAPKPYSTVDSNSENGGHEDEEETVLMEDYLARHDNKTWMLTQRALVEQLQIERICRGEDLRSIHLKSTLSCRYSTWGSPWLLILPMKVEVVSIDPHISIIYDVISTRESTEIKQAARKDLHTPHNQLADRKADSSMGDWSLKHVWMETKQLSPLQNLNRRLSHIANIVLDDDISEPFMVANYGLGGEYKAHRDTHGPTKRPPNPNIGERLATIVTYLEAPKAGGRLVFPWVGVGVDAIEGAAIIWWNLLASHEHDFLTRHAACPILRGHKWITNKWVGYNAQWKSKPCPIDPSKKIKLE